MRDLHIEKLVVSINLVNEHQLQLLIDNLVPIDLSWDNSGALITAPQPGITHQSKNYEFTSKMGITFLIEQNGSIEICKIKNEATHLKLATPSSVYCRKPIKAHILDISAKDLFIQKTEIAPTLTLFDTLNVTIENLFRMNGEIHFERKADLLLQPKCIIKANTMHFNEDSKIVQQGKAQVNLLIEATHYISENRQHISVASFNLSISTAQPIELKGEIHVNKKFKINTPSLQLRGLCRASKVTIETDCYDAIPGSIRADKFKLRGRAKDHRACQNIIAFHPIFNFAGDQITSTMTLRIAEQTVLNEKNTNAKSNLTIKTEAMHSPCGIDVTGSYTLECNNNSATPFLISHSQKSNQSMLISSAGKNVIIAGDKNNKELIVVEAKKDFQITAQSCLISHAKVIGVDNLDLRISDILTVDGIVQTRKFTKNDLSSQIIQQGPLADAHANTLSQYWQTASDGTALISGQHMNCVVSKLVLSHCGLYIPGNFTGSSNQGIENISSVMLLGDANKFLHPLMILKVNTLPSIITIYGDRQIIGNNYITSPKPSVIFLKPHTINYSINNLGGDVISTNTLVIQAPHDYKGVNIEPVETLLWQQVSRGRKRFGVIGPRSKHAQQLSATFNAQTADNPPKPYHARRSVEGTLQLNNMHDYSQGKTQAFQIIGNPWQFTLDLKSQASNPQKLFTSEINLETYSQRFSQLTVPGDASLYQLPAEVRQQTAEKLRTVIMREAGNGPISEVLIHKKYSDAIADLLIRFALMEALDRTYIDKDLTASKLRRNGVSYAQQSATNKGRPESEALLLTEDEIIKANASFVYYIEQVMGPVKSIVVPQLHLSPALRFTVETCTGVSYMRADDNIELIQTENGSVIECFGVIEASTIKLGADYVKLIQKTRTDHAKADLNKHNRNMIVEFDRIDEQSGKLNARNLIEIRGKNYLQIGGEITSGPGGTFIKMEEAIHVKAQKTTQVEQGDKLTSGGKNYALKPEFVKAKIITEGHQKLIGGTILFEGVVISAAKSNHLQAEGNILFKPISATYQGPTYIKRSLFKKQRQSSTAEVVTDNQFSAGENASIISNNGDVQAEYVQFRVNHDLEIKAKTIEIMAAYCRETISRTTSAFSGVRYANIKQSSTSTSALLSSAYINGNLTLRARDQIGLQALQGIIGGNLTLEAKILTLSSAKETYEQKFKSKSFSIQFFGSQAIDDLFRNEPNRNVLTNLMGDVPFIKALQDICMSNDAADLSVASIKAFYDGVSLASMAKTAMNTQSSFATFCGEFTDSLGITVKNANGLREFNPTVGLKYQQTERNTNVSDEIATRLKVNGTINIKGDTVNLEGGCQIKARDMIILAKTFHLACGEYHYQDHSNSRGIGISAQARDGANVSIALESQRATSSQTVHHPGLLHAERSIFISAEDTVAINGSQIRALKSYVKARVLQLISVQDTSISNSTNASLAVGITTPKVDLAFNKKQHLQANVAEMATLCGEQQLEIFAEKIFQAASLIDAPGTLEICHLSGKPLLAVTNDLDDIHTVDTEKLNFRSYNFVTTKFPGTSLQTILQACDQQESALLSILNSLDFSEIKPILILCFCECLPWLVKDDNLFCKLLHLAAYKKELTAPDGDLVARNIINELSPDALESELLLFLNMIKDNLELLLMSLELLAFIISKLCKNAVVWQKEDTPNYLIRKYGNDLAKDAIHILLNEDGSCSRLLQTTHKTQLVDWTIEDIKDYDFFREIAFASGICRAEYTAMLKAKQDEERSTVRASVYAGENIGQAIPAAVNQNPQTQRVTTKSSHVGVGFFHDTKRARVFDDLINPKSIDQHFEPGSSDWGDAFEAYFEYVAEKVNELTVTSNLNIEKSAVEGAIQSLIATLHADELSHELSALPAKLAAQSKEYCDFSFRQNLQTDLIDATTTALMWMALERVKESTAQNKSTESQKLRQDIAKTTAKATSAVSKTVKKSEDKNSVSRTRDTQGRFTRGLFSAPKVKTKSIEKTRAFGSIQLLEKSHATEIDHFESEDGKFKANVVGNRTVLSVTHNKVSVEYAALKAQTTAGDHLSADATLLKAGAEAGFSKTSGKVGAEASLAEASGTVKTGAFCLYGNLIEPYFGVQAGIGLGGKASAGITSFENGKRAVEFGLKAMLIAGIGGKAGTEITPNSDRCHDAGRLGLPQNK